MEKVQILTLVAAALAFVVLRLVSKVPVPDPRVRKVRLNVSVRDAKKGTERSVEDTTATAMSAAAGTTSKERDRQFAQSGSYFG